MKRLVFGLAGCVVLAWGAFAVTGTAAAAESATGKDIFMKYKCNGCHEIAAAGIKTDAAAGEDAEPADKDEAKSPDLSDIGSKEKAEFLDGFLRKKEKVNGKLHKKTFKGTPEERATLVSWLMTLKGKEEGAATAPAAKGK